MKRERLAHKRALHSQRPESTDGIGYEYAMSALTHDRSIEILVASDGVESPPADVATELGTLCEYDPDTERYRARFDSDLSDPVEAIVRVVAAVAGTDPTDLPPLFESVDSNALDALVRSAADGDSLRVSFAYDGYDVTVAA